MICANCRTVNLKGMLFCAKCGRGLTVAEQEESSTLPRLVWQVGEGTPQTYLLTKAATTIGRVSGNDIILPETGVSRQHTRVEREGTRYTVVDLGSLNGTYVNDERVEQARELHDRDVIQIGRTTLQVFIPTAFQDAARAPAGPRRIMDGDTMVDANRQRPVAASTVELAPASEPAAPPSHASTATDPATLAADTDYQLDRLANANTGALAKPAEPAPDAAREEAAALAAEAPGGGAAWNADADADEPTTPTSTARWPGRGEPTADAERYLAAAATAGDAAADTEATTRADFTLDEIGEAPFDAWAGPAAARSTFWLVMSDGTRVPVGEDDGTAVTVGRGEANTIVLSQDRQVSRHHARIRHEAGALLLEDLGSANGTFLNGERVSEPRPLQEGDEVHIGSSSLRVERAAARDLAGRGDDSTIRADTSESTLFVEDEEDASDHTISELEFDAELAALGPELAAPPPRPVVAEAADRPRLNVTWGPRSGESYPLDREVVLIGRAGGKVECDITLQDKSVSSPHAKLVKSGDLYLVHDMESTNGTYVNYEHLTQPRVLQDGDLIKVGKTTLLFRTPVPAAPVMPPPGTWPAPTAVGTGKIITFFSLKGGSGTTTLAVNTALLVHELTKEPTLLVDLALERASITSQMNLEVRRALDDLAHVPMVDSETLRGIVTRHPSGLDVLAAPSSPQTAELVTAELLAQLFPVMKEEYRWIILDTAASFTDINLNAFDQSDLVVLVAAPDLVSLKTMQSCMDVFTALQTTGERRLLALNNIYPKPRLERDEMEKALGERVDLALPYGEEVLLSIDLGVPLAISTREHPFVMGLDQFVRTVAEIKEEAPARTKAARGGFWLKLKGLMARR